MDVLLSIGQSFILGVLTPTTALCVIPLYPAFLVGLARQVRGERETGSRPSRRTLALFGVIVALGVVVFMVALGLLFTTLLQESLTRVIGVVSPVAFGILAVIGVLLMAGKEIRYRVRPQRFQNPLRSAFLYGFFFGAIVVPCNPLFIAAFFARVATVTDFATNMANFLAFGMGIGAPLLAFSLISGAASRWMVNLLVDYHRIISFTAGAIMVAVSVYYLVFVFHVFG